MIDTIKFLVPIDDVSALQKIKLSFTQIKKEDLKTGHIEYEFYSSKVELGSYNRAVIVRVSETKPYGLFIEFSIPKYAKGNNVEMVYPHELPSILDRLYGELQDLIDYPIPYYCNWYVYRLDICYNWIFKNFDEAKHVMSFIQRIDFPRKQKYTYETSVMYKGSAYTIKFYLKGPEFKKNDYKVLNNGSDRAQQLSEWADKILRFEVGMKRWELEQVFGHSPVRFDHISDDSFIEETLQYYLDNRVFRFLTKKNTSEAKVEEILYSHFTKIKATRLYQFYQHYLIEDGAIKQRIKNGGMHRSTIYRYRKELQKIGVGFQLQDTEGRGLLEQLIIPSGNSRFDLVGFHDGRNTINW